MRFVERSNEVYVAADPVVRVARTDIEWLKDRLRSAPRGRVRLCAHRSNEETVHEMVIALAGATYIRPHKHLGKCESFHVIEGRVDVVLFDEDGGIREVIPLGDLASGRAFYYRLADPVFHTLVLRSDPLVIHETTRGPFTQGDAVFAPWAPDGSDPPAARAYLEALARRVDQLASDSDPG